MTTEVLQPEDLSNHAPNSDQMGRRGLGITGKEVEERLFDGGRASLLAVHRAVRPDSMASSLTIMPYMMHAGRSQIAADALYALLSKPPKIEARPRPTGKPAQMTVSGVCILTIS